MRRYQRDQDIWEVSVEGTVVRIRAGRAGEVLSEEVRGFRTWHRALWEADRESDERAREGFVLTVREEHERSLRYDDFEQALRQDPDSIEIYLVYGDWLQSQGDPRGELIAVQYALMQELPNTGRRAELERRENHLLFQHRRALFGALGEQLIAVDEQLYAPDLFPGTWHLGFLRAVEIRLPDLELAELSFAALVRDFLALPSAAFLREIAVCEYGAREARVYREIMDALGEHAPVTLEALTIGHPDSWTLPSEVLVPPSMGQRTALTRLSICAESLVLPTDALSVLTELTMVLCHIDPALLRSLAAVSWPALTALSLGFHRSVWRRDAAYEAVWLEPIVRGHAAPRLTVLSLRGTADTDAVCVMLAASPLALQLVRLDLSGGTMTAAGAAALRSASFPRLEVLTVADNLLRHAEVAALKDLAPKVYAAPQRKPTGPEDG